MTITEIDRTRARADVARPGKFEDEHPMVPILWDVVINGGADKTSDVDGELISRVGRWLLSEDPQGFVYGVRFKSTDAASAMLERIETQAEES